MVNAIVTGFTADCAVGNSRVGFESLPLGLKRAAADLGWNVAQHPMKVPTNDAHLAEADVMFVGIGPFNSVGSRYLFGAMDAVAKAKTYNCALVFYVTDWQTHLLMSSIKTMLKKPHNLAKYFMRARTDFLWGVHNIEYLTWILQHFHDNPWPETIVPMQSWYTDPSRDQRILAHVPTRRMTILDPTTITTATWDLPEPDYANKQRQYVCAALGDYSPWITDQGLGWPVEYRGGKTHIEKEGGGGREVNKRATEVEVNQLYHDNWVGLCPKTAMYKTGWWRTRYDFITRSGAILLGEPDEINIIGPQFGFTAAQLEGFTDQQLQQVAVAQREQYVAQIEPKESVLEKIQDTYKRAVEDLQ